MAVSCNPLLGGMRLAAWMGLSVIAATSCVVVAPARVKTRVDSELMPTVGTESRNQNSDGEEGEQPKEVESGFTLEVSRSAACHAA